MWSILAIGVFLSFRVLDVPDMTCEGSFPLGGAIAASLIASGASPWAAIAAGAAGGLIAGTVTGILYTKLKIPAILAGILTMIALYSINLHIMGKANISLLRVDTVFSTTASLLHVSQSTAAFIVPAVLMVIISALIYWFFGTELGMCIRATGYNPQMVRAQGVNTDTMIIMGLFISNALIGLCGAVVAQNNGFADVGMGIGTIVIGLASVIIGEVILGVDSFSGSLLAVVVGSIIYRVVIAVVLYLGSVPERTADVDAALDSLQEQPWQFVTDIPADHRVTAPGGGRELYCLFAVSSRDTLFLYEKQDPQYPHQTGRELYCGRDGQPILLLCNGTPDTPDTTAVVYCTTGRALDWSPRLSAGTGSPEPVEGVDDFSQHPTPGAAP